MLSRDTLQDVPAHARRSSSPSLAHLHHGGVCAERAHRFGNAFFFFQAEGGIRDYKVTGGQTCALPIYRLRSFFFQAEDGIRDYKVTGVQTCALPIWSGSVFACAYCGDTKAK